MDAAGLGLSVLATFNVVVEDIRPIRDCRSYGHDYEITRLKLQLVEARLVRWDASVGIADHDPAPARLSEWTLEKLVPEEDREKAIKTLQAIEIELKIAEQKIHDGEAQESSDKRRHSSLAKLFSKTKPAIPSDASKPATPYAARATDTVLALANDFEKLSLQRHRRASVTMKAKYVLFEKRELADLLSNIRDLAEELERLFPATHAARSELASEEAAAVQTEELKTLLRKIVEDSEARDETLLDALRTPAPTTTTSADGMFSFNSGTIHNNNHGFQSTGDMNFSGGTINFDGGK